MSDVTAYSEFTHFPLCSCYKLVYDDKSNWLDSTHKCWDDEAQLVSLEVADEMPMVAALRKNSGDLNVLTSAMRFSDGWYWVGSSKRKQEVQIPRWCVHPIISFQNILSTDLPVDPSIPLIDREPGNNPAHPDSKYSYDCLAMSVSDPEASPKDANPQYTLKAVPCSIETPDYNSYMCEVRVQTVTYRAWFQANWLDFTLTALIIILFVALCVTLCCYPTTSSRAYRYKNTLNYALGWIPSPDQTSASEVFGGFWLMRLVQQFTTAWADTGSEKTSDADFH